MSFKPKLRISISERDLGFGRIMKEVAKMKLRPCVKAGITQAKGSIVREDGKLTTAEIARVHEYGAPSRGIPERSFLRATREKNHAKYQAQIAMLRDRIFDASGTMTAERALALIGQSYTADVKQTIRAGIAPGLKPGTVAQKNAAHITKAKASLRKLEAKYEARAFQNALKTGGKGKGYLTKAELLRENKASETVLTGGSSTALIDTGQMINAISYEVVMNPAAEKGGS